MKTEIFQYRAKKPLCFREASKIIKITQDNGCRLEMIHNDKIGDDSSILSLISLGIGKDQTVVMKVIGAEPSVVIRDIIKILGVEE